MSFAPAGPFVRSCTERRLAARAQVQHTPAASMSGGQSFPIQYGWRRGDPQEALLSREWLVTNGLGGYASGTIGGHASRRFHGQLIAALPAPLGRFMMLNHLEE